MALADRQPCSQASAACARTAQKFGFHSLRVAAECCVLLWFRGFEHRRQTHMANSQCSACNHRCTYVPQRLHACTSVIAGVDWRELAAFWVSSTGWVRVRDSGLGQPWKRQYPGSKLLLNNATRPGEAWQPAGSAAAAAPSQWLSCTRTNTLRATEQRGRAARRGNMHERSLP